jgi:hypothetical protein
VAQVLQLASTNIRSMSLQDDVDDAGMSVHGDSISGAHDLDNDDDNTSGMSVQGDVIRGVHDLDIDSDNPSDEHDASTYFEFIETNNKTVWDLQVIVASWLTNIEHNEYTNGIRQDIDKLMIDITMAGSTLEMMSQSQSFKPLRSYKNMMDEMQATIGHIIKEYIELKPLANRMLLTTS